MMITSEDKPTLILLWAAMSATLLSMLNFMHKQDKFAHKPRLNAIQLLSKLALKDSFKT